jgi:hypothetical protein
MPEHESDPASEEFVQGRSAEGDAMPLPAGQTQFGVECACRLARVRRDVARAIRLLAETEERLCLDDQLATARLTLTEAERLDRFCLNLKVSIDELQRWARLLTSTVEALAGRGRQLDA